MENNLIFTDMEIHVLAQTLKAYDWDDFPVLAGSTVLDRQMLDSFFSLMRRGLILASDDGYYCQDEVKSLLIPLFFPDRICVYRGCLGQLVSVYQKKEALRFLEEVPEEKHSCRIGSLDIWAADTFIMEKMGMTPEAWRIRKNLILSEPEEANYQVVLYEMEGNRTLARVTGIGEGT